MTTDSTPGGRGTATILLVEDDAEQREVYQGFLADRYTVEAVPDGETALSVLGEQPAFETILLDRGLPGMDGDAVLEELVDRGTNVPVVVVTGTEPDLDIIEMGMDYYLTKPVSRDQLLRTIERVRRWRTLDDSLQEIARLTMKRTTLETAHGQETLQDDERYVELLEQLARLDHQRLDLLSNFESVDFVAAYKRLGNGHGA
jgi:DNA-binding response OmpR family regulator